MGIEPTYSAWEADVLPLNYTRVFFSPPRGCKSPNLISTGIVADCAMFGLYTKTDQISILFSCRRSVVPNSKPLADRVKRV